MPTVRRAKFVGNRLERALATGSPATFSHQLKGSERRNSGRANSIEYDVKRGRMRMAGKAWYTDGRSEFTTEGIVYNLANRAIESEPGPGPDSRVRMRIRGDTVETVPPAEPAATP